ncbi:unnamed protein product [Adineta steineri]|uniref:Nuclear receptor domain-containing protein n=1 Tax=Adineta steineri TaxID=433720 RepID=A0A814N2J6_9BILA|nr:unnamed protein product [Adineta steineri]CAF1087479.1 unnamed protein product [Adineta steineri]
MDKLSSKTKRQSTTVASKCKVCGAPATYSYYGVISCRPCKIFFKRNAKREQESLKCDLNGHCQISLLNRHICSYCRLKKCFSSGMQVDMFRSSYSKQHKTIRTNEESKNSIETQSTALVRFRQPEQFPTLNLLQSDQSTLTVEQWNHLSNLSHCYDEHSGISSAVHYMEEQNNLPIKFRFKCEPLKKFISGLMDRAQLLYKNNQDFLSLIDDDRSILLHNTIKHVRGLSSHFIYRQIQLINNPVCFQSLELIFGQKTIATAKRVDDLINFDAIIMKLLLAILAFSTTDYTVYSNINQNNLKNIKKVLHFQHVYIDLAWRYLLYKYNHRQAVICFSNVLRCLLMLHNTIVLAYEVQQYTDVINPLFNRPNKYFV